MLHLHSKKALNTFVQGFNVLSFYIPLICGILKRHMKYTSMGRCQMLDPDIGNANK